MNQKLLMIIGLAFGILVLILSYFALVQYPGQKYIYILFTVVMNLLLYFGVRKNRIFFDTFIGLFLWLGFWFKFSFRMAFREGKFHEPVGVNFDFSGAAYDQALLVASCGCFALIIASVLREWLKFNYNQANGPNRLEGLFAFYRKYRIQVFIVFISLVIFITLTNLYFGIYQRGTIPRTQLPFKLSGVYTWLLLFGLATGSALILEFELILKKKNSYFSVILALLETFSSSVSMLSRAMILNASALAIGTLKSFNNHGIRPSLRYCFIVATIFAFLFGLSIFTVTQLRDFKHFGFVRPQMKKASQRASHSRRKAALLILDRWVGIEGAIAVSSYPELGWDLWETAWKEKYVDHGTSFYDKEIATSVYTTYDVSKYHYISLPGIIAFFYYPGSFIFLFCGIFFAGIFGAAIDLAVYRFGGHNVILSALLAQIVASRYAHFGYVPGQSYLLFGTLGFNILIIYILNQLLESHYSKRHVMPTFPEKKVADK